MKFTLASHDELVGHNNIQRTNFRFNILQEDTK